MYKALLVEKYTKPIMKRECLSTLFLKMLFFHYFKSSVRFIWEMCTWLCVSVCSSLVIYSMNLIKIVLLYSRRKMTLNI